MDDDDMFIDILAQRMSAFATLATTLADIEDKEVKKLGIQMLEKAVDSVDIQKPTARVLQAVKQALDTKGKPRRRNPSGLFF